MNGNRGKALNMEKKYDIAAYVWPAYSGRDARARIFWEEGIGEWQSVKNAVKKFPGHSWPRKPLWGYVDEADPLVMERQIDCAADHGVNVFIYDWYWYDGRPFLEDTLNGGYLNARNNDRVKFYIMWANHDVNLTWDIRNSQIDHTKDKAKIWIGSVNRAGFETVCDRVIDKYFSQPTYYRVDGRPVFAIYDLASLLSGLGGLNGARDALDWFRARAVQKGYKGVHLQMMRFGEYIPCNFSGLDGEPKLSTDSLYTHLAFDSMTHYQFVHYMNPQRDYSELLAGMRGEFDKLGGENGKTYYPHISVGWDNNPRFKGIKRDFTWNNTPERFEEGLRSVKAYIDAHPGQAPLATVNSWNEWTESSYLQPDDLNGYGYLEAIKRVFKG
jgi:hypothetical protein